MTHWAFKSLDTLHHALAEELKSQTRLDRKTTQLISIKNQIVMDMSDPERVLTECRAQMCEVCRSHRMYVCDLDEGWSPNCAFLRSHAP
jgi:predicted xylose isomerase-like sugar epimerase